MLLNDDYRLMASIMYCGCDKRVFFDNYEAFKTTHPDANYQIVFRVVDKKDYTPYGCRDYYLSAEDAVKDWWTMYGAFV